VAILWCGGEPLDFPAGDAQPLSSNTNIRTGFSRCTLTLDALTVNSIKYKSKPFVGGGVTSLWFTFRVSFEYSGLDTIDNMLLGGLGCSNNIQDGIYTAYKNGYPTIVKQYAGNITELAAGADRSLLYTLSPFKIDFHVIDYGNNNSVLEFYISGKNEADVVFNGNVTIPTISTLDTVNVNAAIGADAFYIRRAYYSELIVADEDTRAKELITLYPNANGVNGNWVGNYTDIDEANNNLSDAIYTESANDLFTAELSARPVGTYAVDAVCVSVSAARANNSNISELALGLAIGNNAEVGNNQVLTTGWDTYQQLLTTYNNNSILLADINNLQLALKSGS